MKTDLAICILSWAFSSLASAQSDVQVVRFKGDRAAAVSYTFDDGLLEHYTEVFPRLKAWGIQATFCVNGNKTDRYERILFTGETADRTERERPRMTWAMLREMSNQGQEISSHGWDHVNVTKLEGEALRYEVQHNDTAIWQHTGVFPRTYFYPGNRKAPEKVAFCEQGRVGTRTEQVSVGSKRSEEWLRLWVDSLVLNRQWGVGMTHGISYGYDHFADPQVLWNHLAYVAGRRGEVWVATFHDVAAYVKERDAVKLKVVRHGKHIRVTPSLSLAVSIFNVPLTLKVASPLAVAEQDGKPLPIEVRNGQSLVDFNPHGGCVRLVVKP